MYKVEHYTISGTSSDNVFIGIYPEITLAKDAKRLYISEHMKSILEDISGDRNFDPNNLTGYDKEEYFSYLKELTMNIGIDKVKNLY